MLGLSREMMAISILSGFGEAMLRIGLGWKYARSQGLHGERVSVDAQGLEIYVKNRVYKERQPHSSTFLG